MEKSSKLFASINTGSVTSGRVIGVEDSGNMTWEEGLAVAGRNLKIAAW